MAINKILKLFNSSYVSKSDEELMKQLLTNDILAFEELYNRYKGPLYSYLSYTTKNEKAEDLLQEVFIKVVKNQASFKFESKFKTWIWAITRNTLIDYYRSSENKYESHEATLTNEEGEEVFLAELNSNEERILEKTTKEQLLICIEELGPDQKEAVLLQTQSELSNQEIADLMGIKIGAVKSLLFRAKDKLIECFKRGGHL
jgi:RNA polymerase sigma-70 factor (ECF subfamily)